MAISDPALREKAVRDSTSADNPSPVDDTRLVYAIAGRRASGDPPNFVFAALSSANDTEYGLVMGLLLGGAGATDAAYDSKAYQTKTLAGKEVFVGTEAMLRQDSHQSGRPYLYETEKYVFLLVTADETWATDALRQLP